MAGYFNLKENSNFRAPDMGEYYDEDLMEEFLSGVDASNPEGAAYYVEEPFSTSLGYHEDYQAFIVYAEPVVARFNSGDGQANEDLNKVDGDTMIYSLDSVNDGGNPFTLDGKDYKGFKDYCFQKTKISDYKSKVFKVRTVGIDAPEVVHYTMTTVSDSYYKKNLEMLTIEEAKKKSYVEFDKYRKRVDGKKYPFIQLEDNRTYYEVVDDNYGKLLETDEGKIIETIAPLDDSGKRHLTIVSGDEREDSNFNGDIDMGLYAKEQMLYLINNAIDFRLVVDIKQLVYRTGYAGIYKELQDGLDADTGIWNLANAFYEKCFGENLYKYEAFTYFGQDSYKRFLGTLYVKIKFPGSSQSVWVNTTKYLLHTCNNQGRDYIQKKFGLSPVDVATWAGVSDAFKVWTYDNSKSKIADGFYNISKADFDDRRSIQNEITGMDFSKYREFTVMIGDCLFMVPPTSIRVVNQIESERVNILRSKSSATKTKPHVDRIIELTLYFNGNEGINGVPYETKTPRMNETDERVTYYMNGLRTLIAMFRYTPFLPIESQFINETLGIEAVSLANLQISTIPMYPNCIAATLTLQEFNYRIYLNELPIPEVEEGEDFNTNMFAKAINYEVMRYYYQRAIRNGEEIKDLDVSSQNYIEATMSNKTSLIPMEFKDQNIEFFVLDKEWLDRMLTVKKTAESRPLQQTESLNEQTLEWAEKVGNEAGTILSYLGNVAPYEMYNYEAIKDNNAFVSEDPDDDLNYSVYTNSNDRLVEIFNKDLILSKKCSLLKRITTSTEFAKREHHYKLAFDTNNLTSKEISALSKIIAKELGEQEVASLFENGVITVKFLESDESKKMILDKTCMGWKVLDMMCARSGGYISEDEEGEYTGGWSDFASSVNEEFLQETKDESIDIETLYSAKFVPYPFENIVTQSFSISMGNIMANTKLKVHEGYAPQYAGGQDTIIEFMFYTTDKDAVGALNAMQSMAADQLITYRKVINCWPIRMSSEMTRLCGINEVVIESLDISTVPMQPGLFAVSVRAISLDRTMRNREALQRIDAINNFGTTNKSGIASYVEKTYFELNSVLSQAELYPDLELPTIEELEDNGFKFIRYMNSKNKRVYPDPDFYFVYGYVYSAQVLRKTIIEYFSEKSISDGTADIPIMNVTSIYMEREDNNEVTVSANKDDADEVIQYSYLYPEKVAAINKAKEQSAKLSESIGVLEKKYLEVLDAEKDLLSLRTPTWDVCSKIKCTFKENITTTEEENVVEKEIQDTIERMIILIDDELSNPIEYKDSWTVNESGSCENYNDSLYHAIEDSVKNRTGAMNTLYKILAVISKGTVDQLNYDIKEGKSGFIEAIKQFFSASNSTEKAVDEIFKDSKNRKTVKNIYIAAAMALSGGMEYDKDLDLDNYEPKARITSGRYDIAKELLAYNAKIVDENTGEDTLTNNLETAVRQGVTFGPYQTRVYDRDFLSSMFRDEGLVFKTPGFIDNYYNKTMNEALTDEELYNYKKYILICPAYAFEAFNRNVLVWIKNLLKEDIFISYYDIMRDQFLEEFEKLQEASEPIVEEIRDTAGEHMNHESPDENCSLCKYIRSESEKVESYKMVTHTEEEETITNTIIEYAKEMKDIVSQYDTELVIGKIFVAVMAAVVQGDGSIYKKLISKDIDSLKSITEDCKSGIQVSKSYTISERYFRKMIRGLASPIAKTLKNTEAIASSSDSKLEQAINTRNEKLWMTANQDPSLWMLHSYYDMVMNDKRGRMARAFPTYYMLLIDEGREIGYWKLHDNFYNTSSISEFEVIKSRKIPADTARIVLTNLYKTFTTEDEDIKTDYTHNARDVFTSIFSPRKYAEEAEDQRRAQMEANRVSLKPGARVHLRMGYSSDASELPIVFNGVIAEVSTGELMEIVCQGDGHEISTVGVFGGTTASDLADLSNESSGIKWFSNFLTEGDTPKGLIRNVLTTKSGWLGKKINHYTNGRFFNDNMFGVTHFGEIDYKDIHKDGEIMQNIYEGEGGMPWNKEITSGSIADEYYLPEPPSFTVSLNDKSVWDMLNTVSATSLEFITGIAPFGLRSTIFHGRPHYYYAYNYTLNDHNTIVEKRKPYQQYHIIDSYSDIIHNTIKASGTDIKTVAIPIYNGPNLYNKTVEKKFPYPLYIDWDIYPEFQKTMIVNTNITYKANKLGFLFWNKFVADEWGKNGGQKLAFRVGARALKESVKDMYEGEVSIIGDPSIKPLDKVYLTDIYEDMSGMFEVEAVVHSMTSEGGFVTSIYPDCVSTVDSRYEQLGSAWSGNIAGQVVGFRAVMFSTHKQFNATTKPMLNFIASKVNKSGYIVGNSINKAAGLLGKDELIKYASMQNWSNSFYGALGLSSNEITVWSSVQKLKKWKSTLSTIDLADVSNNKQLASAMKVLLDATDGVTPKELTAILNDSKGSITKLKSQEKINDAIKALDKLDDITTQIGKTAALLTDEAIRVLSEADNLDDASKAALKTLQSVDKSKLDIDTIRKLVSNFDEVADTVQFIDSAADVAKCVDTVTDVMKHADDIIDASKVTQAIVASAGAATGGLATVALIVAEMVIEYALVKGITNKIENFMASKSVLTIHPLKKNGTVYVAGIDGHKGLVVGSTTWNSEGPIDSIINWAFKDRGFFYSIVKSVLFTENMQEIAETYKKDNNLGDGYATQEDMTQELIKDIADGQMENYATYKSFVLQNRIDDLNSSNAKRTYRKVRITDIYNTAITADMIPICDETKGLDEYYDGFFYTAHETIGEIGNSMKFDTKASGEVIVKSIKVSRKTASGEAIKLDDIPFLRPDAYQVLLSILEKLYTKATYRQYGDEEKANVIFKSGTVVGDNNWDSTGYMFRLETTLGADAMEEAIKSVQEDFRNAYIEFNSEIVNGAIDYQRVKGKESFDISVAPRDETNFKINILENQIE